MEVLSIGGWMFGRRLFCRISVANSLWYFDSNQCEANEYTMEKMTHLFSIGWFEHSCYRKKLFTIIFLFFMFRCGLGD